MAEAPSVNDESIECVVSNFFSVLMGGEVLLPSHPMVYQAGLRRDRHSADEGVERQCGDKRKAKTVLSLSRCIGRV